MRERVLSLLAPSRVALRVGVTNTLLARSEEPWAILLLMTSLAAIVVGASGALVGLVVQAVVAEASAMSNPRAELLTRLS